MTAHRWVQEARQYFLTALPWAREAKKAQSLICDMPIKFASCMWDQCMFEFALLWDLIYVRSYLCETETMVNLCETLFMWDLCLIAMHLLIFRAHNVLLCPIFLILLQTCTVMCTWLNTPNMFYCYVWIYLLNITLNIQQTNEILQFIFLRQGQNGLFTFNLTPSSSKNGWKTIKKIKVRFRAIQVS